MVGAKIKIAAPWKETELDSNDLAQAALLRYAGTMGVPTVRNVFSENFGHWFRTPSGYLEEQRSKLEGAKPEAEHKFEGARLLGDAPRIKLQKILKPRSGDLRAMVLPGGGDRCLRMWAGIRRYIAALTRWL